MIILLFIDLVGISQKKCVDSTQSLPLYCPFFDDLTDCVKIERYVGRQKTVFEICDDIMINLFIVTNAYYYF